MKLYIIRHGESETNLEHRFTGWAQANLTEQGVLDAKRTGERLKDIPFDRIYSSDLVRAVQTAQNAIPGCKPVQLSMLREISVGAKLEWRTTAECEAEYGADLWKNHAAYDFTPYGGECEAQLIDRVREFLSMLEKDPRDYVAAFSHAGFISCLLREILELPINRKQIRCANGSIAVFAYENGRWILEKWGA